MLRSVASLVSDSATPWTAAHQAPLSMGFSRQEHWSGLPCLPPGDLPHPGIEPKSLSSPALQADSVLLSHWGSPTQTCTFPHYISFKILPLRVKVKMKSKKVIVNLVYIIIYNREHRFGLQRQLSRNFWVSQSIYIHWAPVMCQTLF